MEVETVARQYLRTNYGNMVQLGEYSFEEEPRFHRFRLRSNYPFMVSDDANEERITVRILKMERLGNIIIDENLHVDEIQSSSRKAVIREIRRVLTHWRNRVEQIVAAVTSSKLARLTSLRNFFAPVEGIVLYLQEEGRITVGDLHGLDPVRRQKYLDYIQVMEGQDLLERHNGGWRSSFGLNNIIKAGLSLDDMVIQVIAVLIEERYRTLQKEFKVRALEAPIRLQNTVYLPELEVQHTLARRRETFQREIYYHYRRRVSSIDMVRNLRNLAEVEAVQHDKKNMRYSGQEDLLRDMIRRRSDLTPVGEMHTSRT